MMIENRNKRGDFMTMTEKEKAEAGVLYNNKYDEELVAERMACNDLCHALNLLKPSQLAEREAILRRLFGAVKGEIEISTPFYCDYGYHIEVGERFYANYNCVILDEAPVIFGDDVFIGPHCGFYTAGHPIDFVQRNKGLEYALPIKVGNNVWFGGNVSVLPGVTIGDDVVIGAGSLVNRDIPSGVIAAGNPCKVIRKISDTDRNRYLK